MNSFLSDLRSLPGVSDSRTLFRAAIVLCVLGLSAYLGRTASLSWVFALVGIAFVAIVLIRPALGVLAVLVSALLVPFTIATGTQTALNSAILLIPLLLIGWVLRMVLERRIWLVPANINRPALFLILSTSLSLLSGNLPWDYFAVTAPLASQLGGWTIVVFSAAILLLVGNQIGELIWLKWLTVIFIIVGVAADVAHASPLGLSGSNRVLAAGAEGSLFWTWLTAMVGGHAFFNRSLSMRNRTLLVSLALVTGLIGWYFQRSWVAGWLPPFGALLTLIWLRNWRVGLVLSLILFAYLAYTQIDVVGAFTDLKQYSIDTRNVARDILLERVFPLSPVIGTGPANYYWYVPNYPILGYYVQFNSHNQYVDILVQYGLLGAAAFSWLVLAIAKLGWDLRERSGTGFARGYVYGCLAGLVGMLIAGSLADWVLPFVYNIGINGFRASIVPWLFLGGLVTIKRLNENQEKMP